MSQPKKKCRQYSIEYLKYGFIPDPKNEHLPMCLICEKSFSNEAMKPSRLADHLSKIHNQYSHKELSYFQTLKTSFQKRKTVKSIFESNVTQTDDGLRATYNLSLLIAKSGKSHSIGEDLLLPAISEVVSTVLHRAPGPIIKVLPLSDNTVRRRIDEMAEDVEKSLCEKLRDMDFSIQLDESTLPGNESLLLAYVRFIENGAAVQELLFSKLLNTDTKGATVFETVSNFFDEKKIPLSNIIACATDGAPAMVGRYNGFLAHLKKAVPGIVTVHCVIHRQHLVAKCLSDALHDTLGVVIKSVNKIKASALNSRLFNELCIENDEDFQCLLLHTEVRWLSKGNCLTRLFCLFDSVVEFLKERDNNLCEKLQNEKKNIAFLTDLFEKFNEVNKQLQGDDNNMIKTKSIILSFLNKLDMFHRNIGRKEFTQFARLLETHTSDPVCDENLAVFTTHLQKLHVDMETRFKDILNLDIPDWVLDPFNFEIKSDITMLIEEELITLKNDFEIKPLFKDNYRAFWLKSVVQEKYKELWKEIKLLFIAFPTSYLVERGFSAVARLMTKQRNRLKITERGDLRLLLTKMKPDVDKLAALHQPHPSH